ncbi:MULTISPECIES: peroxiredoxin [Cyanophyceae]|nr:MULTISPECIES: peroxiredoxin [unclassified Picosynechococcus]
MWFPGEAAIALGGPQPELNQLAPEFTLLGNDGEGEIQEFSLQDYRGQWVVLYFYPQDFTPGCTLEARRFQQDLPKYLERNVQVLGVSVDDVDSHEAFCDAEGLKFPLLADSTGDVSKQYGSYLTGYSLRHTYLIDPEGILRKIYLGVNPAIHSQEVLTDLDSLMANSSAQLPPMG